jgi:amino acid adenylation domain-containing protein
MAQTPPNSGAFTTPRTPPDVGGRGVSFPVSFAQQRVWFLHHLEPTIASYNLPVAVRLTGPLDVGTLEESLNEVVRRHDSLRTSFPVWEGRPVQVIGPVGQADLREIDLTDFPPEARETEAARLASGEANLPFDLAQGPLFRAKLLRLCEEEHVLIVTMHHIVSDGWSVGILMRELAALYEAFRLGRPSPLPELPIQYADYSLWQQDWLRGDVLQAELDYWKSRLDGIPALIEVATDRPRSAVRSLRGASLSAILPPGLLERLKALSRSENSTLFMTLLAAFQVLLSRYTGLDDIPVGSPIAGRTQVETEGLIGFFVNTLVLRGDLSGDPSFRQLLARVRETALEAFAHQDLPFEKLVEELQPVRTPSQTPLFQILFQVATSPREEPKFPDLKVSWFPFQTESAKFDLSLSVIDRPDRFSTVIEYRTDLYDRETIRRMLGHWQVLLTGIATDPDRPISDIPLIGDAERRQILVDWNATKCGYPREKSVAEVFEAQAAATPDAIALLFEAERMTYAELNTRANRLAHCLRDRGVSAETPVGVFLERSPDLVVALLAILKAGGAYVPLDPSYPRERLGLLIRETGMGLLLTDGGLANRLPTGDGFSILRLESEAGAIRAQPGENVPSTASGDSVAYVMYTSGSTGTPKGVLVPHRGILRLVKGVEYVRIGPEDVFLQLAAISFDASTFELWGALLNGARCVLFPGRVPMPSDLRSVIAQHHVSILWLTASLFDAIVDKDAAALSGIRHLLIGGEALSVEHVRRALESLPTTQITNGYGPTESTTFACCYRIPNRLPESVHSIPIGRPISNTRAYILDRRRQPVPVGIAGELHIGGDGLARGYLDNPELTAEKFILDPFSREPGERLYRTGDLARYRSDGQIEFLGRLDKQLKIRGFRVEPGEIEAVVAGHPAVASAVVVAREDVPGDRRLVAYLTRRDGRRDPLPDVRDFLASKLPEYMVPSAFVVLGSLPLNATGKVDWRALPHPVREQAELGTGAARPQDTLELVLLKIWEDTLELPSIGVEDDFFELGGHSLLAVRLFAEIEKSFGRRLPLATLFQAPTVARLAAKLREKGWEAPWSSLVVIQRGARERSPFLCVPGAGGNILGFCDLARHLGPNQPVYGLQARGLDGQAEPLTRIQDIAAHYIEEIKAVLPNGPFLLGGFSFGGSVAFEMARQLDLGGDPVALVVLFDAFAPGPGGPARWISRMSRMYRVRRRWRRFSVRVAYHGRNLLLGPERVDYFRSKARTLRERIRSQIRQRIYSRAWSHPKPLSRALQGVREANYRAKEAYVPRPYRGKVTLFRAAVRSAVDSPRRDMGWERLALGGVEIREVPGDHVSMLRRPQIALLAEQLRECIEGATGAETQYETASGSVPA